MTKVTIFYDSVAGETVALYFDGERSHLLSEPWSMNAVRDIGPRVWRRAACVGPYKVTVTSPETGFVRAERLERVDVR